MNKLSEFELAILRAVTDLGGESYGVPIAERMEFETGKRVSTGTLYLHLASLETQGFLSSRLGEATPERGMRQKKFYAVTEKAKAVFEPKIKAKEVLEKLYEDYLRRSKLSENSMKPVQRIETRRAFYAGVGSTLIYLRDGMGDLPEEVGARVLQDMLNAIVDFWTAETNRQN